MSKTLIYGDEIMDIEKGLKELEEITNKLEKNTLTVDENLVLYEKGKKLVKELNDNIKNASLKVQTIKNEANNNEE